MKEFKPISEWIAEGKERSELIGYVDKAGRAVFGFEIFGHGERILMDEDAGRLQSIHTLSHRVAPPQPKRLSDGELVASLIKVAREIESDKAEGRVNWRATLSRDTLRTQILERMKAKGPTRGEVGKALPALFEYREATKQHADAVEGFLSMFPKDT